VHRDLRGEFEALRVGLAVIGGPVVVGPRQRRGVIRRQIVVAQDLPRVPYMTATSIPSMSIAVRVEGASYPRARAIWKCGCRARLRRRNSLLETVAPVCMLCAGIASPCTSMPMIESVLALSSALAARGCCWPPKNRGGLAL
jgi:hypothetical protein